MIVIEVSGQPAPQGSKRPVRLGSGKVGLVESSKAVGPWREAVRAETQRAMNGHGALTGPVQVTAFFRQARPKGHYRTGRHAALLKPDAPGHPAGRPDLDKLLRALLDGLTMGGAWLDDAQVVQIIAAKQYGPPGCRIEIERTS